MKAPNIYYLDDIQLLFDNQTEINGQWVTARPMGYSSIGNRLKCAWLAFTGKCDLIKWPGEQ